MNYVGSISILDRGDAPAQAVIDRNARSLAQRVADETKEELHKVMTRVDNICGNFELASQLYESNRTASLEYANDLADLEELLKDQVKKKKYQQQVTIFVVGYENVCGQKLRLLSQVNEFFMENSNKFEEDEMAIQTPDLDLDEMADTVEETLKTTESLAEKLGELNQEMVEYMYQYAQTKASNKGKKKLEKALNQAKDDINIMNEKLLQLQSEIEEKEDKMQQLFKQIEMKNMEAQRYKTAADVAKKNSEESDKLREEVSRRDVRIKEMRQTIDKLEIELGEVNHSREQTRLRLKTASDQSSSKLKELNKALNENHMASTEAHHELQFLHESQLKDLMEVHQQEVEDINKQHQEEVKKLLAAPPGAGDAAVNPKDLDTEPGDRSRPVTMETQSTQESLGKGGRKDSFSNKPNASRQNAKTVADSSVQDEGGDPDKAFAESSFNPANGKPLPPVTDEEIITFDDQFELKDDDSWAAVPGNHIPSRFVQYRNLTVKKMDDLENQIVVTVKKTQRKINTLKAQFQEHKSKWEAERNLLIQHIQAAQSMQGQAEEEATAAISQLEEFINEQENLEIQEDEKRKSLGQVGILESLGVTSPIPQPSGPLPPLPDMRPYSPVKTPMSVVTEPESKEGGAAEEEDAPAAEATTEDVGQNLLAQTDDAKVEQARSTPKSRTNLSDGSPVEKFQINGISTEEIARSASQSRASLREQHRSALSSLKKNVEGRRTHSPMSPTIMRQKSVLSEAELDEDGDMPFPPDITLEERQKVMTMDQGTSPINMPRENTLLSKGSVTVADHPIVQEFLRSYEGVLTFKDALAQLFMDKEMMSLGHVLGELEPVGFDKDDKIQPQVEHMTNSIYNILEESANLMSAVLTNDRDYPVSSLVGLSHEATRTAGLTTRERTMETFPPPPHQSRNTQFSAKSSSSSGQGKQQMEELQTQYQQLQQRFEDDKKKYDEQLNHNTVLMMEMQDTIQALQKELSNLGNQAAELTKPQTAGADSPIMFTRNDLERNAKIMKRAVSDRRLPAEKYQDVVDTMDEYVSLPAKRLGHLVTKYVHHCQMKEIESNVRQSRRLDEDVFSTLDRMEALQNDRARRWAEHMDEMGSRRLELANMLMQKLNHIEEESGIFLIKPLFSYKAPAMSGRFISKMNRPQRMVREFAPTASTTLSQYAPLPTPATTIRPSRTSQGQRDEADAVSASVPIMGGTRPDNGLAGHSSQLLSDAQRPVWSQGLSQTHPLTEEMKNLQASHLNMPRILELDINRMLIGHNQISMKVPPMLGTNDRLVNAANTNVRSYMTVARPTGSHAVGSKTDRPRSHGGSENSVPPTTPMRDTHAASPIHGSRPSSHADLPPMSPSHQDTEERGRMSSRNLPSTPPLPPITPSAPADGSTREDFKTRPLSRPLVLPVPLFMPRRHPLPGWIQLTSFSPASPHKSHLTWSMATPGSHGGLGRAGEQGRDDVNSQSNTLSEDSITLYAASQEADKL